MHLMHEDLARAHSAHAPRGGSPPRAGPPSRRRPPGGPAGRAGRDCAPAVSSPSPSSGDPHGRREATTRPARGTHRRAPTAAPRSGPFVVVAPVDHVWQAVGTLRGSGASGRTPAHALRGRIGGHRAGRRRYGGRRQRDGTSTVEVDGRRLSLSNLDKVLYPRPASPRARSSTTTPAIAPVLLPHIADRPMSFQRFPDGVDSKGFFAKNAPQGTPDWVRTVRLPAPGSTHEPRDARLRRRRRPADPGLGGQPRRARAARARSGPSARAAASATPNRLVLDLDPGGAGRPWSSAPRSRCCSRELVEADGLAPAGQDERLEGHAGLRRDRAGQRPSVRRTYAQDLAQRLEKAHPKLVVSRMAKNLRRGKVFVDWSQNNAAKTTVAPYALRARPEPWVSTPLTWDEVEACRTPEDLRFRAEQVLERVDELGDLFAPLLETGGPRCPDPTPVWTSPGRGRTGSSYPGRSRARAGPSAGEVRCTGRCGCRATRWCRQPATSRRGPGVAGSQLGDCARVPTGLCDPALQEAVRTLADVAAERSSWSPTTSTCWRPRCGPGPRSTTGRGAPSCAGPRDERCRRAALPARRPGRSSRAPRPGAPGWPPRRTGRRRPVADAELLADAWDGARRPGAAAPSSVTPSAGTPAGRPAAPVGGTAAGRTRTWSARPASAVDGLRRRYDDLVAGQRRRDQHGCSATPSWSGRSAGCAGGRCGPTSRPSWRCCTTGTARCSTGSPSTPG